MITIKLDLSEELTEFIACQATIEGYSLASEYIIDLIQRERRVKRRADLEASLLAGVRSIERGEGRPFTPADWERLRSEIRERYGEGTPE